ncbi:MAG: XTP/dITP diphosphatase [Candidatus Tritonobacter lacicola]|nr:XTP/dITP diphosphatase [Candidatus Tritonobacter lacicola]
MVDIIVATRNKAKIAEFAAMWPRKDVKLYSPIDFPDLPRVEEDGGTFRENAIKKATTIAAASGKLAIADDSGLEVDELGGQPGVLSARFSGEGATDRANNEKLLSLMKGLPPEMRRARFICAMALADPGGLIDVVEGRCEGVIADRERGTNGFGYDPVFIMQGYQKAFAELGPETKNRISHRARAIEKAVLALEKHLGTRQK